MHIKDEWVNFKRKINFIEVSRSTFWKSRPVAYQINITIHEKKRKSPLSKFIFAQLFKLNFYFKQEFFN